MIRFIHRKLIIPKGDTGNFYLPVRQSLQNGDKAVFVVFETTSQSIVLKKTLDASGDYLAVFFSREDTENLPLGKYEWDIRIYHNPEYNEDGEVINGLTVDSYYSAYQLPQLIIKGGDL